MTTHLYPIVEGRYDTSKVAPGCEVFVGHDESCSERTVKNMRSGSESGCTCGYAELQVHAWPLRAGEGVPVSVDEGEPRQQRTRGKHAGVWCYPPDAPILEAWERLRRKQPVRHEARDDRGEPDWQGIRHCVYETPFESPPDGLYAYVPRFPSNPEPWVKTVYGGTLDPVQDVTEEWGKNERTSGAVPQWAWASNYLSDTPAKALRLSIHGKVAWVDPELLKEDLYGDKNEGILEEIDRKAENKRPRDIVVVRADQLCQCQFPVASVFHGRCGGCGRSVAWQGGAQRSPILRSP